MRMTKKNHSHGLYATVVFTACLVIMPMSNANAEPSAPAQLRPIPDDAGFKPTLGTYSYTVDFNNMSIGAITLTLDRENDLYTMQVYAKTTNMFDRLYKFRYRGTAAIDSSPFSPIQTKVRQQVKTRGRETTTTFQQGGTIKTLETKTENGEVESETNTFQPEKFMIDPFSATYLVRGFEWKTGVEKVFDVFSGKSQYELRFRCEKQVLLAMGGVQRAAWEITPTVINRDPEHQAKTDKKPKVNMKIYLSADDQKDVLKIEASNMLGYVNVVMEKFEPAHFQGKVEVAPIK